MKGSTRVIDRLLTGVVGLVLLVGGAWLIAQRLGQKQVTDAADRLRSDAIVRAPDATWWPWAVGAGGLLLVLLSLWLLVRHLGSSSSKTVTTDQGGTVDLGRVGDAVATDLARSPIVRRARSSIREQRGVPIIRIAVSAPPDAPVDELLALARAAQNEVTLATTPDVQLQVLVNGEDTKSGRTINRAPATKKLEDTLLEK